MTSFNVNNDDAGLHIRPSAGRAVKEVQPYPGAHAVEEDEDTTQAPRQSLNTEKRRKTDRRRQQRKVLLNTRCGHDRRNTANDVENTGVVRSTGARSTEVRNTEVRNIEVKSTEVKSTEEKSANETGSASGINVYT
ncbi:MAG: hypothetical protein COB30_011880 [Ectothiorhodospiraceae bacterium]|nr:hypothetical protein [Ectothiorhodospiraceae bacterium]